mmetsp:Transcript_20807/g.53095  ORF Transcript_20807/g.53095 Transcript_20807/m.53095 type:complete len:247 (-) Transcript_20807:465-1205(-)
MWASRSIRRLPTGWVGLAPASGVPRRFLVARVRTRRAPGRPRTEPKQVRVLLASRTTSRAPLSPRSRAKRATCEPSIHRAAAMPTTPTIESRWSASRSTGGHAASARAPGASSRVRPWQRPDQDHTTERSTTPCGLPARTKQRAPTRPRVDGERRQRRARSTLQRGKPERGGHRGPYDAEEGQLGLQPRSHGFLCLRGLGEVCWRDLRSMLLDHASLATHVLDGTPVSNGLHVLRQSNTSHNANAS